MALYYVDLNCDRPDWLGGGQWMLRGLQDITVLFGKNGSGKSLLLRNLNESPSPDGTHYTSPERAGEFVFDQNIMQQELDPKTRGNTRKGVNYSTNYRRESISRISSLVQLIGYEAGRGREIPKDNILNKIEEKLSALLPEFRFSIINSSPFFELERIGKHDLEFKKVENSNRHLSSGEAEAIAVSLDLLTICNIWKLEKVRQRLLLIDEPDPHLHPDLQVRFAKFLFNIVETYEAQAIVATHSTTLLAAIGHYSNKNANVIYLNNSKAEQKAITFSRQLKLLSAALGGHALIGPLFGAPLLLVEGDDDYRIWSHVPRQPGYRNLFSVIPCDGDQIKDYQILLEDLFASLRDSDEESAGFVLLDNDKEIPLHTTQNHVRYIKLECHEAENLYLTDEVLESMGITWDDAIKTIEENADRYGNKADKLKSCKSWERAHVDLKGIINELTDILDNKKLHWTMRVGQTIGRREPRNELAHFLGQGIITALWPALIRR